MTFTTSVHGSVLLPSGCLRYPVLEPEAECIICTLCAPQTLCIPCGHQLMCEACHQRQLQYAALRGERATCPLCRSPLLFALRK